MKRLVMNAILASDALVAASGAASAGELKFEVPFAFQATGKVMAAGTYTVRPSAGEKTFY